MSTERDYPERWQKLAKEAIAAAHEMSDPEARRALLFIAQAYKRLAEHAQARKNQEY